MKLFRKNDIIIIAVTVILALVLFIPGLFKSDKLTATVYVNGKIEREIDLKAVSEAYVFSPKSGTEIEVDSGKIRFKNAVCRDKLCINSGWLDRNGQTSACLPERIVICIKGNDGSPDVLTY